MEFRRFAAGSSVGRILGRSLAGMLGLAAAAAVFTPAEAQAYAPYTVRTTPAAFQELPIAGGSPVTTLSLSSNDDGWANSGLPFPVRFFDTMYSELAIGSNGYATFGPISDAGNYSAANYASSLSNQALPSTSNPNQLIAIWWDDQYANSIKTQVLGAAPQRTFIVQWDCFRYYSSSANWKAQLWLREGSSTIEVRYGTIGAGSHSSTLGIESPGGTVGWSPRTCGSNCSATDFPSNTAVTYSQGPDVTVTGVTGMPVAYSGVMSHLEAASTNAGGQDAFGFGMKFWLSTDQNLSTDDVEIGTSPQTFDAAPGVNSLFTLDAPMPLGVSPGAYYVLAQVDPLNVVTEDNENNNVGWYGPFQVGLPAPDMIVESITDPVTGSPGGTMMLDWTARNIGNLVGTDVPYTVVLSRNSVISSTDLPVYHGTVTVPALDAVQLHDTIALPTDLSTGPYFVGVVIDPENVAFELDDLNNIGATVDPFLVSSDGLFVVTQDLPAITIGSPWCVGLIADGGNGSYMWSLENGALPSGISIEEERAADGTVLASLLCGTPTELGRFDFSLRVTSGSATAVQNYALTVNPSGMPLVVASLELPTALFQQRYEADLMAVGGTAPYQWKQISGELPAGMAVDASGSIRGVPMVDGSYTVGVQVEDSQKRAATASLTLEVAPPRRLTCVTRSLPEGMVGTEFPTTRLLAAGGNRPYTFTTRETQRLSNGSTDTGKTYPSAPPPGLAMDSEGVVTGTPTVSGSFVWSVEVKDGVTGATDICTISYDVGFESGLTILSSSLADAWVDTPYSAQLLQTGGVEPIAWTVFAGSELPPGITLTEDGRISGLIANEELEGATSKTFAFVVQARDANNRTQVASLSITARMPEVKEPKPESTGESDGGGCQSGAGAPGLAALAFGLLLLRRRR